MDSTLTDEQYGRNLFSSHLNIHHLLTHRPAPLDFVLPGLPAGSTGLIVGPGGVGKTMLELQTALGVACGESVCGGLFNGNGGGVAPESAPAKVVLVVAEESMAVIWGRLHAIVSTLASSPLLKCAHCHPDQLLELWVANLKIHALAGTGPAPLMDKAFVRTRHFYDLQGACEGARLVILDPLRQFHQCDENDSAAMTSMAQHMQLLATGSGSAVIGAHHTNRNSGAMGLGDTAGASRGSSALTDAVRWQLNLSVPTIDSAKRFGIGVHERNRFLLVDLAKGNYAAPQDTQVLQRLAGGVLARFDAEPVNGTTDTRGRAANAYSRR